MTQLWMCKSYAEFGICLNAAQFTWKLPEYSSVYLNVPQHVWASLNIAECPWIFLKMFPADLVIFTEEILNGKPHVFMQCCKYARVAKMQQLRTVLNILKCAWIIMSSPQYIWILLKKRTSEYNMTSSVCYFVALPNTENQLFIYCKA